MKSIGGYFEFERFRGYEFHLNLISLNTARNAFEYILISKKIKKIFIPFYICSAILEPLKKLKIEHEFYSINKKLEPILDKELTKDNYILIVNYFGLIGIENKLIEKLKKQTNIILDNTQAFFEKPQDGIDTFYSCRKFFGVSDGAYLSTDKNNDLILEQDYSYDRYNYLIKRFELNAEKGYELFKKNEELLSDQSIKYMSKITKNILKNIDYQSIKKIRENNFDYLRRKLGKYNILDLKEIEGPMVYPFLIKNDKLRNKLIENKIYVATYWKEVLEKVEENSFEENLVNFLFPIPIDQRYTLKDMEIIANLILKEIE